MRQLADTIVGGGARGFSVPAVQLGPTGFTWVDTGGRFASAPVPGATGIAFELEGDWSATDPFDGPHAIGPAMTVDTALTWMWQVSIIERTPPDLSSDIFVGAGLCNEGADSGTLDGVFAGILYGGASRTARKGTVANGAVTVNNGSTDANIRILQALFYRNGGGATARWQGVQGRALDAARAIIAAAALGNSDHGVSSAGNGSVRPFLFIGRTSGTDVTTRTLTIDFQRSAVAQTAAPT